MSGETLAVLFDKSILIQIAIVLWILTIACKPIYRAFEKLFNNLSENEKWTEIKQELEKKKDKDFGFYEFWQEATDKFCKNMILSF